MNELGCNLVRDVDRPQRFARPLADARDCQIAGRNLRRPAGNQAGVLDCLPGDCRDRDTDLELLLEVQRAMVIERRGDARPPDFGAWRRDAEAGLAPQRVLGLLHVAEEPAEMHDAGGVRLVELDASGVPIFTRHSALVRGVAPRAGTARSLWSAPPRGRSRHPRTELEICRAGRATPSAPTPCRAHR